MADKTLTDRLQPSLLDRLTDHHPGQTAERREERVIDISRLREIIQRDLSWLLNTTNLESDFDAEAFPMVAQSVLNYGLAEVSGEFSTMRRAERIRASIECTRRRRTRGGSARRAARPRAAVLVSR